MIESFGGFYAGKTVLVTGASGFKGSWLSCWLTHLGARVVGYSLAPPSSPSNFEACGLETRITHIEADIRDYEKLHSVCQEHQPDVVFHLAAQPLVRPSYENPRYTFDINLMGTVNALEAARRTGSVRSIVAISSDKCYENLGVNRGYREDDRLGGYDPYSASKACAELAIAVYRGSWFQEAANPPSDVAMASCRAGNVIGGGDWAEARIVPDIMRAITSRTDIAVRNPDAIRPWQHVLEPLSAYLMLGARIAEDRNFCSAWNFGPADEEVPTVEVIVQGILNRWQPPETRLVVERDSSKKEALLLKLDCSKAEKELGWRAAWDIDHTLDAIVDWYREFYTNPSADMFAFAERQIDAYTRAAREQGIPWAAPEAHHSGENE